MRFGLRMNIVGILYKNPVNPDSENIDHMNKRDLNQLKKRLEKELADLAAGKDCNLEGLDYSEGESPDLIDRAASVIDRSLSQNFCDRKNLRIHKVEQALEDLKDGLYGICQSCGDDIAIKRLKANPVARQCISCKTEMETRQRLINS